MIENVRMLKAMSNTSPLLYLYRIDGLNGYQSCSMKFGHPKP